MTSLEKLAIKILTLIVVISAISAYSYSKGKARVEAERLKDRQAYELVVQKLEGQILERQRQHNSETERIAEALSIAESKLASALAASDQHYAGRLRDSEQRAGRYRALAEASTTQCVNLAGYAAELDRSIEEGRYVVGQLRSTVELRDQQLRLLGSQIIADRRLLDEYSDTQ